MSQVTLRTALWTRTPDLSSMITHFFIFCYGRLSLLAHAMHFSHGSLCHAVKTNQWMYGLAIYPGRKLTWSDTLPDANRHLINSLSSRTTWVSQHQKSDFNEARDGVAVASAGPHANHLLFTPDR